MRKHLVAMIALILGAAGAVAVAQDMPPSEASASDLQALNSGPRPPPELRAGAWEITTRTIRSNCPQGVDQETSYTGTLSRGPGHMSMAVPTSANWKQFRGEVVGNQVMFTAYQDVAAVRARASSSSQIGVFHIVAHAVGLVGGDTLEGYGFRSTWLPPAGGRRGGICDESLSVRLRKL